MSDWTYISEKITPEIVDPISGYSRDVLCALADGTQRVGFWRQDGGWLLYDPDSSENEIVAWKNLGSLPRLP